MADQVLDIADDGTNDFVTSEEDGKTIVTVNYDHIQRSKLRFDARRWYLSKLAPKRYGDATLLKHADPDGNAINFTLTRVEPKK